jgi:cadmium resistance protein CadD (predicted permease)
MGPETRAELPYEVEKRRKAAGRLANVARVSTLLIQVGAVAALFAGTNVDDMVIISLLSASARAGRPPKHWQIWAGQYVGFAVLIGASLLLGRALALAPERFLWVLAILPFGIGAYGLVNVIRSRLDGEEPKAPSATAGMYGVAAITIIDGGDDLAAYTPFYATIHTGEIVVSIVVFAVIIALWCLIGGYIARYKRVAEAIEEYGEWILPITMMLLGVYVLGETLHW